MKKSEKEKTEILSFLITTSRNPTHFLRRTSNILAYSIPNSQRMNRGSLNLKQLYNYCWNRKIPRLFILNKSSKGRHIVTVKVYLIVEDIQLVDSKIEISEIISLKRHNNRSRIMAEQIQLKFSKSIDAKLKENALVIFNPIISPYSTERPKYSLSIEFSQESHCKIIGKAIQQSTSSNLHIYTLHISSCDFNGL